MNTAQSVNKNSKDIPRNYILYGVSKYEGYIYGRFLESNKNAKIFSITSDEEVHSCLEKVKYRPLFANNWVVIAKLDGLTKEYYFKLIKLLVNPNVACYFRIYKNNELYASLYKSGVMKNLDNLYILNAKTPSFDYVSDMFLKNVKKKFEDFAVKYVYEQVKFNIEELDKVIGLINASEFDEIGEKQIKMIVPPSKSKNIRHFIYQILLNFRDDLPALWKNDSHSFASKYANKKKTPYAIVDNLEIVPYRVVNYIVSYLFEIKKIRALYFRGEFTENSIFDTKEAMKDKYPFMKKLSIPTIREYIFISRETTKEDIDYCLNAFLKLKAEGYITIEKVHLVIYKLLNRRVLKEEQI